MQYVGPRYLVQNATNGCVRGIQPPTSNVVTARCADNHYRDVRLSDWKVIAETGDIRSIKMHTQVIEAYPFIYVNCPSESIAVGNQKEVKCPPYPFVLDYMTGFATPTYDHSPSVMEINMNLILTPSEARLGAIHFSNFSYTVDKLTAISRVRNLTEAILELDKEISVVKLPFRTITFKDTTYSLTAMVGLCLTLIVYMYYASTKLEAQSRRDVRDSQRSHLRIHGRRVHQLYEQLNHSTPALSGPVNYLPLRWRQS